MIKIELKQEFVAHEITAADFDGEKRPDIRELLWRVPTRTVRMTQVDDGDEEDDDEEYARIERKKPSPGRRAAEGVAPLSFYGIGCFIIVKNGRAIGIMSPTAFAQCYREVEE